MAVPFHLILLVSMVITLIFGFLYLSMGGLYANQQSSLLDGILNDIDPVIKQVTPALKVEDTTEIIPMMNEVPTDIDLKLDVIGGLMALAAVAVLAYSAFGIFAAIKRMPILLFGLIATIVIAMIIEIMFLLLSGDTTASFHTTAKDALKDEVKDNFVVETDREFDKFLNSIMILYNCCGITGPGDFLNLTYTGPGNSLLQFKVAPACCNVVGMASTAGPTRAFYEIIECAKTDVDKNEFMYKAGCYDKVFIQAAEAAGTAIVGSTVFLIILQVIQIILAILAALAPSPEEEKYREGGVHGHVREPGAVPEVRKQFIPFSKVSSFISADVSRIKSTEIW